MLKLQRIVLVVTLLFGMSGCGSEESGETKIAADQIPSTVADQALRQIAQLATNGLYAKLGFESVEEAARATLGPALPVYFIGLRDMRNYTAETEVNVFLGESQELIYPVKVDDRVRSSVGVQKDGGDWQVASMGRPNRARGLEKLQALHNEAGSHNTDPEYFVVEIPSLYLIFLGHREGGQVKLIPTEDNDDLGFSRGRELDSAAIFGSVKELAMVSDGALTTARR